MKQLKIIVSAVLMLAVVSSCRKDDPNFIDFENLDKGAYLRVVSLESGIFDLLSLSTSSYGITWEFDNSNNESATLTSVDVSVAFVDNTPGNGDNSVANTFLETISGSSFTVDATSGKPRFAYTVDANTVLSTLGLVAANLDGGDQIQFDAQITLSDGATFGPGNLGLNVGGGAFFASPFRTNVSVVCLLTDGYMIGNYQLDQTAGPADPFFGQPVRFASEVVAVAEGATPTQRTFPTTYLGFALAITIDLVCGNVTLPQAASGVGCGGGLFWVNDTPPATFDPTTDAVMTINLIDDVTGDCGLTAPVTLTMTKQ